MFFSLSLLNKHKNKYYIFSSIKQSYSLTNLIIVIGVNILRSFTGRNVLAVWQFLGSIFLVLSAFSLPSSFPPCSPGIKTVIICADCCQLGDSRQKYHTQLLYVFQINNILDHKSWIIYYIEVFLIECFPRTKEK